MRKMADGESITLSTAISAVGDDGAPKGRIGIPHFTIRLFHSRSSRPSGCLRQASRPGPHQHGFEFPFAAWLLRGKFVFFPIDPIPSQAEDSFSRGAREG